MGKRRSRWPEVRKPEGPAPEAPEVPHDPREPEVREPDVREPEVREPEPKDPDVTEPGPVEPEVSEPETSDDAAVVARGDVDAPAPIADAAPRLAPDTLELPFDPPIPVATPPEPAAPPPPPPPGPVDRARVLSERGDHAGAIALLTEAIERAPNDLALYLARGIAFTGIRRFPDAERDLARAQKLGERDPAVLVAIGTLRCRSGRWRDAVPLLEDAVRLDPDRVEAHYFLGEALNHVDRLDDALAAYDEVVRRDPGMWRAHQARGMVLDRLARREDAAEAYRLAREARER